MKGNARGGAKDLALHLMKDENDHVTLHELRGFTSSNLMGALNEAYAISKGTHCRQYLYSLSLNPPETEQVSVDDFRAAIEGIEQKLNLADQPRAIVFHEKEGRRHAHCVWSRIDVTEMKAVQMSYDRTKLKAISRELFLEHGWQMPRGLANASERDPRNFTLADWQQAKRNRKHASDVKIAFQDAWAISDSKIALSHALEERGYKIARGNRGRFVGVDIHGEVYAIAQQANVKANEVRARLGDANDLPSVNEVTAQFASEMSKIMTRHKIELKTQAQIYASELKEERQRLINAQRDERANFLEGLQNRQQQEALRRQARFRNGLGGIWDRMRGEHTRIQALNEKEARATATRDAKDKDQLVFEQLIQRKEFKENIAAFREKYIAQRRDIQTDQSKFESLKNNTLKAMREVLIEKSDGRPKPTLPAHPSKDIPEPER